MSSDGKMYMRGNQAAAEAARLSRIEFMGAYPIPPSSEIMESISTFIKEGRLNAGFIEADGEKSAQMACFAAVCSGCRTFNATSSQGLLYMHESLPMMVGNRMPMVMVVGNRSVFAPHGMMNDHSDVMLQRDTGWLQLHCETVQEVFDTVIQGYKIVENQNVKIPMMVCMDGYLLTHSLETMSALSQEQVDAFLPPYAPGETDYIAPGGLSMFTSFGMMDNWFAEFKYQERVALENSAKVIEDVDREFAQLFGRGYGGLVEPYLVDDAELVIVGMGSMMGTVRYTVDIMRAAGKRVGMVKIRSFRPFPKERLVEILGGGSTKMVIAVEKFHYGALFDEVRAALYGLKSAPKVMGFGVGLNGRNVEPYNIIDICEQGYKGIAKRSLPQRSELYFIRKKDAAMGGN
jgi:pyruvate ferredoxin oxidoreductase alpha subunit